MALFALVWDGGRSRGCPWCRLYVMFGGGARCDAVLPGYPVCAQAGECCPFLCSIMLELELLLLLFLEESVGNCRVTLKSVCRYPEA